ncbi:hypothetical protein [Streptomyces sp. NPDC054834]
MTRLRGGAVGAAVIVLAVAGCTDQLTEGKTGYSRERLGTAWADTGSNSGDTGVISVLRGVITWLSQVVPGVVRYA